MKKRTYSILIIDDAFFLRNLIKKAIAKKPDEDLDYDFEILTEAQNGEEGLELYQIVKPDIVTVDINMPKLNGIEFIKKLKKLNPYSKIIVISANLASEYKDKALEAGAFSYIQKPFQDAYLWSRLDAIAEELSKESFDIGKFAPESNISNVAIPSIKNSKIKTNNTEKKIEPSSNQVKVNTDKTVQPTNNNFPKNKKKENKNHQVENKNHQNKNNNKKVEKEEDDSFSFLDSFIVKDNKPNNTSNTSNKKENNDKKNYDHKKGEQKKYSDKNNKHLEKQKQVENTTKKNNNFSKKNETSTDISEILSSIVKEDNIKENKVDSKVNNSNKNSTNKDKITDINKPNIDKDTTTENKIIKSVENNINKNEIINDSIVINDDEPIIIDDNEKLIIDDEEEIIVINNEEEPIIIDDEEPIVINDDKEELIIDNDEEPIIIDNEDTKEPITVNSDEELIVEDDNEELIVIDNEEVIIDDNEEVITINDDEEVIIDDNEEPIIVDDIDDENIIIDDNEEPIVIDEEPIIVDDEPIIVDDEEEVIVDNSNNEIIINDEEPITIEDEPIFINEEEEPIIIADNINSNNDEININNIDLEKDVTYKIDDYIAPSEIHINQTQEEILEETKPQEEEFVTEKQAPLIDYRSPFSSSNVDFILSNETNEDSADIVQKNSYKKEDENVSYNYNTSNEDNMPTITPPVNNRYKEMYNEKMEREYNVSFENVKQEEPKEEEKLGFFARLFGGKKKKKKRK